MAQNEGDAQLQRRTREAEGIKITAGADAERTRLKRPGGGRPHPRRGRGRSVRGARAVDAMGGPEVALRKMVAQIASEAMQHASQPLVPQIVLGERAGGAGLVDVLMAMAVSRGGLEPK